MEDDEIEKIKNDPELVIIRGASGSGKSTFVSKNFSTYNHFEADMYFVDDKGNYNYDTSKKGLAHEWCLSETKKSLQSGKNTVVSNTFIKIWEVQKYLYLANALNVPIKIYRLTTQFHNTHGVPNDVVERMRTTIEPIDREIVIG